MRNPQQPSPSGEAHTRKFVSQCCVLRHQDILAFHDTCAPHLAGKSAAVGGLIASDWHTVALTMQLAGDMWEGRANSGMRLDEMRWWDKVHPGDSLRVRAEVCPESVNSVDGSGTTMLLWTVNQFGRCVFSCLVTTPRL